MSGTFLTDSPAAGEYGSPAKTRRLAGRSPQWVIPPPPPPRAPQTIPVAGRGS